MANEWNMPRPAANCAACGREFAASDTFQAAVFLEGEDYIRRDFCLNCTPPSVLPPLGIWRAKRAVAAQAKSQTIDREALYAIFCRLDEDEPQRAQFRFVLALLLWRKKAMQLIDTFDRDGREFWRFTAGKDANRQTHDLARPEIDESEVERLSSQLESLLSGGADEALLAAPPGGDAE